MIFEVDQSPELWARVHIRDVAEVIMGQAPPGSSYNDDEIGVPLVAGAGDLGEKYPIPKRWTTAPSRLCQAGDIIYCIRATIGELNWADKEYCLGRGVAGIRANSHLIASEFLFYWLIATKDYFIQKGSGSTFLQIRRDDIEKASIMLPPLPEQERIVAILREADDLRRQQQTAVATAQTLIPALFHHMFGDSATNPKGWPSIKLEKVCNRITDGTHQPPNFDDNGTVPFLFVSNIVSGKIDFNTEKFIAPNTYESLMRRCPVEVNDILYSTVGSYGVAVQVDTEQPFAFQRLIAHIKPDHEQIDVTYLTAMLNSVYVKAQADRRARGIAQKTVNLNEIGRFQILLPPKPLQEEFGKIINQEIKTFQLEQHQVSEEFENLVKSLLARAFDGELTEHYRQNNFELLQVAANKRDALLGHVRHLAAPVVAEPTGVVQVLNGRNSLARSLSQPQQTFLQTIVAYLQENGRRYFTLPGFLADHLDIPPNAIRQNVELFEKVGLLTRVARQVEPEGIPYFETFYRLTKDVDWFNLED